MAGASSQSADRAAARSPLRLRADLRWVACPGGLAERWRVKDPVALEYHEFGADERFLLEQFDGRRTLTEIRRRYDERFRPKSIGAERLLRFAAEAHARGLLLAEGRRQGATLGDRGRQARRRARWARLFSVLFLRLPGFDPSRLLDALAPVTRWFWRPVTMIGVAVSGTIAAALLVGNAGDFAARLPTSGEYLQAGNLAILIAAFVAMKAAHELAHGLACRDAGARCHEMGVVLIALMPCLYCDVTDLWMVPSRWRRVVVSAAGMYVELTIAIICCLLWIVAADGVVSAVLLNLMLAGAVSTLLFNANPLLKLDGYFILSDLADVSNLHERSRRALVGPIAAWFRRGQSPPPARFDWPLAGFAVASFAYRVFVVVVIAWAAHRLLSSFGLRPVGDVAVGLTVIGLFAAPVLGAAAVLRSPLLRRAFRWGRVAVAGTVLAVGVALLLITPWPRTITAPVVFEARDAQSVAAVVAGRLTEVTSEGERVAAGAVIARLENPDLTRRRVRLVGERRRLQSELDSLRRRATIDPALLTQIPTAEAAARQADDDLTQLDEEIARLTLTAPCDGVVIGAARRSASRQSASNAPGDRLPRWEGRLVDAENLGCWVAAGEVACLVAPSVERLQATLMIDPSDTKGVRPGLPARVLAYQSRGGLVRSTLTEVAQAQFDQLPEALRRHPDLLTTGRDPIERRTLGRVLLARIELEPAALKVAPSSLGRCKIEAASEPIGALVWRWLAQTFPFVF